ncbi:MAG TPA: two-component regulator propeller domain-containing protein [Blastocatellia bacterium]|nr:two-component regulator propeller domain-containing protein [Blastocatellia bacterium]
MPNTRFKALTCALTLAVIFSGRVSSLGEERTQRRHDQISGSPSASIFSVAQDEDGFLWVGIEGGGLARFDGREFRRWAPDKLTTHILFARSAGEALVLIAEPEGGSQAGNTLYRIAGDGVEQIPGPDGQSWTGVRDAAYDELHRLWVARRHELFYRSNSGEWIPLSSGLLAADQIRRLAPNRGDGVFVVTTGGILSIDNGGSVSRIAKTSWAADVIDRRDGSIFYAEMKPDGGGIFELRDGRHTELAFLSARFNQFVLRGRAVWAAFDKGVVALRSGEEPELLGPAEGVPGGVAFVDREGSLWAGTADGLVQIPEPETVIWDQRDGLPVPATRYLAKTNEGLWLSTWGGLCRLNWVGRKWKVVVDETLDHKWPLMVDGKGRLWGKHWDEFLQRVGGRFKRYPASDSGTIHSFARASDGTLWIGTDRGLFKTSQEESAPVAIGRPPGVDAVDQVLEDSRGELWVTTGNRICHAPAAAVASGRLPSWSCDSIERVREFSKILETPGGVVWAAAHQGGGAWRYDAGQWKIIPASRDLPLQVITNLVPSQSGGIWVLSSGSVFRVVERSDLAEGWVVVEEISTWQGLPHTGTSDLIEEADGSLWIATDAGVIRMRPDARRAHLDAPRIKQTALMVNGRQVEPDATPRLAYGSNQIELHFAALSYRSPELLRYQYRLRPDDPWIDSKSDEPVFRFFDLRPGQYGAEVRASLDGVNWSTQSARIDFEVLSPWYRRWWAIGTLLLLIALALFATHRARVAVLVRLERQRSLIAMDLHDEIGSGLGSIGILSGVAASEHVGDEHRRELAHNIVDTAAELGSALTDIVWSLHPDSASLEGLAYRLTQRAYRLFPDGSPTFKTDFTEDWPGIDLSLAARHNLLLIASEALHNAARHANAQRVELGIAPAGKVWRLWVRDDGCGLGDNGPNPDHSGLGLITMRKRAEEIGAEISWTSADGVGTTVTVLFSPEAKDRRAK